MSSGSVSRCAPVSPSSRTSVAELSGPGVPSRVHASMTNGTLLAASPSGPGGAFDLGELTIHAGDDVAFCHSIVTVGTAEPASRYTVRLTVGLRKVAGEWIVVHEHHSGIGE